MKDYSYITKFDKKDLPYIYRLAEEVRATHNQDLVSEYNSLTEKKWNDHNPILTVGNRTIEPLEAVKSDDLVVNAGVNRCIDQILGISTVRWQLMTRGIGTTLPNVAQTTIVSETLPRVDMSLFGWREFAGATLRFAAIYGESAPTAVITECAVFSSTADAMLNRNVFGTNFQHVINEDGFVISSIVEFVPVA